MCCLRAPKVGGSFSLSAMNLQNSCQCNCGMLESWMPFGLYAVQTHWAKVNCKSSLISASSQSVHRASVTQHLLPPWTAWTKLACLSEQTVQCCLPQRMHGVLAKLLPSLAPVLPIMALSAGRLMPWRWRCSLAINHNCLWSEPGHPCLEKRKSSVHPWSFAVADTPKHIINVSASSWLLSGKGCTSLLLLLWLAAEVIINLSESLL